MRKTIIIITSIFIVLILVGFLFFWNQNMLHQNTQPENWILSTRTLTIQESKKLNSDIKSLYEEDHAVDYYFAEAEIINPTFKQVFPEAQLYKIQVDIPLVQDMPVGGTQNTPEYKIMVKFHRKNYRMPLDFNQLMVDTGYEINAENQDALVHALIVAALPAKMIEQSMLCNSGYPIDKDFGSGIRYTHAVDCRVEDVDVSAWFWEFDQQFSTGLISWGELTEYGYREIGKDFSVYPVRLP